MQVDRARDLVLTREGADRVLLAQVEALHVAVLGAAQQHVHLGGVEADLVNRPLVLGEQLVLLVAGGLAQVPGDHHAVGGGRGQQVLVHLVPDHISAAEVEGWLAAHAQVELLHKLLLLDGVDLEDVAAGHHHLGGVAAHADGVGGRVQVAEHGAARDGVAAQGRGDPGHLLHGWRPPAALARRPCSSAAPPPRAGPAAALLFPGPGRPPAPLPHPPPSAPRSRPGPAAAPEAPGSARPEPVSGEAAPIPAPGRAGPPARRSCSPGRRLLPAEAPPAAPPLPLRRPGERTGGACGGACQTGAGAAGVARAGPGLRSSPPPPCSRERQGRLPAAPRRHPVARAGEGLAWAKATKAAVNPPRQGGR